MPRAASVLTVGAVVLLTGAVRADPILLVASSDTAAPLARALGDAGLEPAPETTAEPASRASEVLAEATRAFEAMDPAAALQALNGARAELDRTGGDTAGPATAARTELLAALALAAAGRPATEVDDALRQALAVSPGLTIDPVEYPPWLRARVATLARAPAPTATIELRGAPGAEAFVDGTRACVLPCARELPVGLHRIRVERAGRLPWAQRLDLAAATIVEVTLRPDVAALSAAVRAAIANEQPPEEALSAFDRVLWATRRAGPDVLEGVLFDAAERPRRATVPIEGTGPAALEHASRVLVDALTAPARASDPIVEPTPRSRRRTRPTAWYERPWVWIATGAVVVAGGVAAALASTGGSSNHFDLVVGGTP